MTERTAWQIGSADGLLSPSRKKPRWGTGTKVSPTVHGTVEEAVYMSAIKDVLPHRIVSYSIDTRKKSNILANALIGTVTRRADAADRMLHTERGSKAHSRNDARAWALRCIVGSRGGVGPAGGSAAMERFFSLLRKGVQDPQVSATGEELGIAMVTWVERSSHRRRQATLGRLTPIDMRN